MVIYYYMKRIVVLLVPFIAFSVITMAQVSPAEKWADSVLATLSPEQRIAQLMVLRLTGIDANRKPVYYDSLVGEKVKQYNIGGVCIFQGNPVRLAGITNKLQGLAKTPIMVTIDAEWGVGMRLLDSVQPLPHQMMLGAMQDARIVYQYGQLVAEQCKRLGIQVNYAPVVDVNNNPNNPVINDRSFGEDKNKVAAFGVAYMKGMQDAGVMACAKHFPGHGDVAVDSHYDLPVIKKSLAQLDSLELYPFKTLFKEGVGSVMIAHLYIPAIDSEANRATSISKSNVTGLMRNQLGYQGLTFTDALEMQGVKKFFPDGAASVESIIAGNDMLCLPGDVDQTIDKIKAAIKDKRLSWADIDYHCRRVLLAKYNYGMNEIKPVDPVNITVDLNKGIPEMKKLVAENALTLLNQTSGYFPMTVPAEKESTVAYVGIGINNENELSKRLTKDYNATAFYFGYKDDSEKIKAIVSSLKKYERVIIGIHNYSRRPDNNFGISSAAISLVKQLQQNKNTAVLVFGNPYAIKNFCDAKNLIACYEDDPIVQTAAADFIAGKFTAKGTLPVTICDQYQFGSGMVSTGNLPVQTDKFKAIDSIAAAAIEKGATPGCVVLAVKDGKIIFHKAYGHFAYDNVENVPIDAAFDMASVTKICATTISIMKLYEQGKIGLRNKLVDYLPLVKGTNKENLVIEDILLHQAGLAAFIPFFRETMDTATGKIFAKYYSTVKSDSFNIPVATNLFLRSDWNDTMFQRILESPLGPKGKYVYSDNDFIFLGKVVEAISGLPLNKYVQQEFYKPMALATAGFKPKEYMAMNKIAPTEQEPYFRNQLIRGYVHDPGAAMFGGVAGHAGLFSSAYDIACLMQMLMNGGTFNGKRYLKKETIDLFNEYHSTISRRGLGFDKPEKDNYKRPEPYPCLSASPKTFGHTGFTGTCTWADPQYNLVYVFLSNRVSPNGTNPLLGNLNVRPSIQEAIYAAIGAAKTR